MIQSSWLFTINAVRDGAKRNAKDRPFDALLKEMDADDGKILIPPGNQFEDDSTADPYDMDPAFDNMVDMFVSGKARNG